MTAMPTPPDPSLETIWNALAAMDPADGVLQALALTRALHRGGIKLQAAEESAPACIPESRELLSSGAVDSLMRLLKGEYSEILPEWLGLASSSGRGLPGRVLPEILTAATKDPKMRSIVRNLSGERGSWIARRHSKFSWLLEDVIVGDDAWDDGVSAERITWLRQTRASDPTRAMEAVASHWAGEDAPMREAILKVISENPLATDEAWLEQSALTDRRQEIRELAASCLTTLPDSTFRKRALDRVRSRVKIQRRLLKRVFVVEPPEKFDPSWTADGLKEKPPQGTGEKAWWLRQMIAMVALNEWPAILDCEHDDLFRFHADPDWRDPLVLGWIDAARRTPDRALPEQFVPFVAALDPWPAGASSKSSVISSILDALPATRRIGLLDDVVGKLPAPLAVELMVRCAATPEYGKGKHLLQIVDSTVTAIPAIITRAHARALALCIPQEGIQQRLETLAKLPELSPAAEEFATTLEFRRAMRNHFYQP